MIQYFLSVLGSDFTVDTSTSLVFDSGLTDNGDTECVTITIIDDDIYEEDQQFTVNIDSVDSTSAAMIGMLSSTDVVIQDNDGW